MTATPFVTHEGKDMKGYAAIARAIAQRGLLPDDHPLKAVTRGEFALFVTIRSMIDAACDRIEITQGYLVRVAMIPLRSIQRYLAGLEKKRVIEVIRPIGFQNTYRVLIHIDFETVECSLLEPGSPSMSKKNEPKQKQTSDQDTPATVTTQPTPNQQPSPANLATKSRHFVRQGSATSGGEKRNSKEILKKEKEDLSDLSKYFEPEKANKKWTLALKMAEVSLNYKDDAGRYVHVKGFDADGTLVITPTCPVAESWIIRWIDKLQPCLAFYGVKAVRCG